MKVAKKVVMSTLKVASAIDFNLWCYQKTKSQVLFQRPTQDLLSLEQCVPLMQERLME